MPDEHDPEQGRPIGKWGYIYYIGMGLLYSLATLIFIWGDW